MEGKMGIYLVLGIMLAFCGWRDFKTRRIPLWAAGLSLAAVAVCVSLDGSNSIFSCAGGTAIGILLIAISKATKGQIGLGDGIIFCVTGAGLGFWDNLWLLMASLFLTGIFAAALWIVKKAGGKARIPFVPFVFLSYIGVLGL